ncbi:MAG: tetratricopeptide repeat protein [Alphaproteobacteria bacterium]|nr:tetratricopeptide repeat protein [Alphaproteobacteria bacterium]
MSDIFREVEEEVRRERLERIWKEYGDYIVAAAALVILAAAAFRLWTYYEARERARASNSYLAAQQLLQTGQPKAAAQTFARLSKTAPGGYAKLSQLQEAGALAASGNKAAALANYRRLAADSDEMISAVARIRAAWILVEAAPKAEVENMIGPLSADSSPWQPLAREILAYADYRAGALSQALAEFRALAKDAKAPDGVRGRSNAVATYLAAGGDKDVGKVSFPEIAGQPKGGASQATSQAAQLRPQTPAQGAFAAAAPKAAGAAGNTSASQLPQSSPSSPTSTSKGQAISKGHAPK